MCRILANESLASSYRSLQVVEKSRPLNDQGDVSKINIASIVAISSLTY